VAHSILVVDDDPHIRDVVRFAFEKTGMAISVAQDGKEALRQFDRDVHELIVLDIGMPEMDGLEVCRQIRKISDTPILFLSARDEEIDRILGLEIGGDDYVTKPFSPRELVLRVRSVLRRARGGGLQGTPSQGVIGDGRLAVDLAAHQASLGGRLIALTSREYDLLVFMMCHPLQAFTREQLLEQVWNWSFGDTSTVTVHVRRLREKLEADPTLPQRIVTVWGVGYRYEPEAA
jgi:DNA-binding response OmpR family regulator